MGCLYPTWIVIKEGQKPSAIPYDKPFSDPGNARYAMVPCHRCEPCLRRRAHDWYMRIRAEYEYGKNLQFLMTTISFSDENMIEEYTRSCLALKMRKAFDVFRKRFGFTPKYVFFSEHGDNPHNKHRFHLHGFLIIPRTVLIRGRRVRLTEPLQYKQIHELFNKFFGYAWIEPLKSAKGVTYAVKYITKTYVDKCEGNGLIIASVNLGFDYAAARARYINSPDYRTRQRLMTFHSRNRVYRYAVPLTFKRMAERVTNIRYRFPISAYDDPLPIRIGSYTLLPDAPSDVVKSTYVRARALHASLYPDLERSIPRKIRMRSSLYPTFYLRSNNMHPDERFTV